MPVRRTGARTTAVVHPGVPVSTEVKGICIGVRVRIVLLDHFPFELLQHVDGHVQRFAVTPGHVPVLARVLVNVKQAVAVETLVRAFVRVTVGHAFGAVDRGQRSDTVKQSGRGFRVRTVGFRRRAVGPGQAQARGAVQHARHVVLGSVGARVTAVLQIVCDVARAITCHVSERTY